MNEIFITRDTITDSTITVLVSTTKKGIDISTIEGNYKTEEEFEEAWERTLREKKSIDLMNFLPLTVEGAEELWGALTKILEAED